MSSYDYRNTHSHIFPPYYVFASHIFREKMGLSLFGVGEWVGGVVVLVG